MKTRTTRTRTTISWSGSDKAFKQASDAMLKRVEDMTRRAEVMANGFTETLTRFDERPDRVVRGVYVSDPPKLEITPKPQKPPKAIVLRKPGLLRRAWYAFFHWIW